MYDARVGVGFQSTIPITKADADVAGGVKVLMISAGFSRSTSFNQFLLQDIERRYRDRSGSIELEMGVYLVEYRTRDRGRQRITYPASMAYLPVWSGTAEWAASANATSMSRKMLCDAPLDVDVDVDVDAAITQISLG